MASCVYHSTSTLVYIVLCHIRIFNLNICLDSLHFVQLKGSLICSIQSNLQVICQGTSFKLPPPQIIPAGESKYCLSYNILPKYIVHAWGVLRILMISSHLTNRYSVVKVNFNKQSFKNSPQTHVSE